MGRHTNHAEDPMHIFFHGFNAVLCWVGMTHACMRSQTISVAFSGSSFMCARFSCGSIVEGRPLSRVMPWTRVVIVMWGGGG